MNTGIKAKGNLEFIYPGTKYIGHEGEYSDWPVNKKWEEIYLFMSRIISVSINHIMYSESIPISSEGIVMMRILEWARYSTHDDKARQKDLDMGIVGTGNDMG